MHMRHAIFAILVFTIFVALSAQTFAGGYAVVRLDESPGEVLVDTPWRFGFMVLQHDIMPNSDVTPIVRARHKETGEEVTATGRQEGKVGHFVAELIFPRAGYWKWAIEPRPFAETSFETLTVLESSEVDIGTYPAQIFTGSCAELGDVAFPLGDVEPQVIAVKSAQLPVGIGVSTIDTPLSDLLATGHAIAIGIAKDESAATPAVCGDLSSTAGDDAGDVVVGLQDAKTAENVGVAVLRDEAKGTMVTLYLLNPELVGESRDAALTVPEEALTVEIIDAWTFEPHSLEVAPGDTVTWVNNSEAAHTVTGDDLAFDDSGLIEPGDSFRLTFDEPGTYRYKCGPHPEMVGVIVVA